jgi:hypothetical protein
MASAANMSLVLFQSFSLYAVTSAFAISMTFAMIDPPNGAKTTRRPKTEYVASGTG